MEVTECYQCGRKEMSENGVHTSDNLYLCGNCCDIIQRIEEMDNDKA